MIGVVGEYVARIYDERLPASRRAPSHARSSGVGIRSGITGAWSRDRKDHAQLHADSIFASSSGRKTQYLYVRKFQAIEATAPRAKATVLIVKARGHSVRRQHGVEGFDPEVLDLAGEELREQVLDHEDPDQRGRDEAERLPAGAMCSRAEDEAAGSGRS